MTTIRGMYEKTSYGFTNVYSNNTLYTIATTGDWACISVGERTYMGQILTQEIYDSWKARCKEEGTFELD